MHNDETIDLTNVPDSNFIEEPGVYDLAIVAAEPHIFKSGSTGFMIKLRDEYGRQISDRVVVNEKTLWKVKQMAGAAQLSAEQQAAFHYSMLIGKVVKCTTELDDENYNKIVRYAKSDAAIDIPAEPAKDEVPF